MISLDKLLFKIFRNNDQVTLYNFLQNERKIAIQKNIKNRETKIIITSCLSEEENGEDCLEREFIIKTNKVNINYETNGNKPVYMHMFIETTQISQLEEARAQNHYQRQMLANVSHEFRTPLNAMMMSHSLMKGKVPEGSKKFLSIASSS